MKNKAAILLNAIYWIAYTSFIVTSSITSTRQNGISWASVLPLHVISIGIFYYFYWYLTPELLVKKDLFAFIKKALLTSIACVILSLTLQLILTNAGEDLAEAPSEKGAAISMAIQWMIALFVNTMQLLIAGFMGTLIKTFLSVEWSEY